MRALECCTTWDPICSISLGSSSVQLKLLPAVRCDPRERIDSKTGVLARVETDDIASAWFVCRDGIQGQLFVSRATPNSGDRKRISRSLGEGHYGPR